MLKPIAKSVLFSTILCLASSGFAQDAVSDTEDFATVDDTTPAGCDDLAIVDCSKAYHFRTICSESGIRALAHNECEGLTSLKKKVCDAGMPFDANAAQCLSIHL